MSAIVIGVFGAYGPVAPNWLIETNATPGKRSAKRAGSPSGGSPGVRGAEHEVAALDRRFAGRVHDVASLAAPVAAQL